MHHVTKLYTASSLSAVIRLWSVWALMRIGSLEVRRVRNYRDTAVQSDAPHTRPDNSIRLRLKTVASEVCERLEAVQGMPESLPLDSQSTRVLLIMCFLLPAPEKMGKELSERYQLNCEGMLMVLQIVRMHSLHQKNKKQKTKQSSSTGEECLHSSPLQ